MTDFIAMSRAVDDQGATGLTLRQLALLQAVTAGHNRVRTAAEALNVSKPVITKAVSRLSVLGFTARHDDPEDRRSVIITVTPAGTATLTTLGQAVAA